MISRSPERLFHEAIFFGNYRSTSQSTLLKDRLDYALTLLGGLQQPGHPESEEEDLIEQESYRQGQEHVRTIALDILAALGFDADKANLVPPSHPKGPTMVSDGLITPNPKVAIEGGTNLPFELVEKSLGVLPPYKICIDTVTGDVWLVVDRGGNIHLERPFKVKVPPQYLPRLSELRSFRLMLLPSAWRDLWTGRTDEVGIAERFFIVLRSDNDFNLELSWEGCREVTRTTPLGPPAKKRERTGTRYSAVNRKDGRRYVTNSEEDRDAFIKESLTPGDWAKRTVKQWRISPPEER